MLKKWINKNIEDIRGRTFIMNKTPSNQLIPSILTNEDVFCMELSESEILHNKIEHIKG